jgi:hypothetical protein
VVLAHLCVVTATQSLRSPQTVKQTARVSPDPARTDPCRPRTWYNSKRRQSSLITRPFPIMELNLSYEEDELHEAIRRDNAINYCTTVPLVTLPQTRPGTTQEAAALYLRVCKDWDVDKNFITQWMSRLDYWTQIVQAINDPTPEKIFFSLGAAKLYSTDNAHLDTYLATIHAALADGKYIIPPANIPVLREDPITGKTKSTRLKTTVTIYKPHERRARFLIIRGSTTDNTWYETSRTIIVNTEKCARVMRLANLHPKFKALQRLLPLELLEMGNGGRKYTDTLSTQVAHREISITAESAIPSDSTLTEPT